MKFTSSIPQPLLVALLLGSELLPSVTGAKWTPSHLDDVDVDSLHGSAWTPSHLDDVDVDSLHGSAWNPSNLDGLSGQSPKSKSTPELYQELKKTQQHRLSLAKDDSAGVQAQRKLIQGPAHEFQWNRADAPKRSEHAAWKKVIGTHDLYAANRKGLSDHGAALEEELAQRGAPLPDHKVQLDRSRSMPSGQLDTPGRKRLADAVGAAMGQRAYNEKVVHHNKQTLGRKEQPQDYENHPGHHSQSNKRAGGYFIGQQTEQALSFLNRNKKLDMPEGLRRSESLLGDKKSWHEAGARAERRERGDSAFESGELSNVGYPESPLGRLPQRGVPARKDAEMAKDGRHQYESRPTSELYSGLHTALAGMPRHATAGKREATRQRYQTGQQKIKDQDAKWDKIYKDSQVNY